MTYARRMSPWWLLYSGVLFVIGLTCLFFPARVRSALFPNAKPSRNPFDTSNSLMVNRIVGVGFLFMAAFIVYAWMAGTR